MNKMLVDINKMEFVDGKFQGELCEISELNDPHLAKVEAKVNFEGLQAYENLIEQYSCDGLFVIFNDGDDEKLQKILSKERYKELNLICGLNHEVLIDQARVCNSFSYLSSLFIGDRIAFDLNKCLLDIKYLTLSDLVNNPLPTDITLFPHLEGILLKQYKGNFSDLAHWNLKTLFLENTKIKSLAGLEKIESIETLLILGGRKNMDLSALSHMPNLKNLRFEGSVNQDWSPLPKTLEILSIEKVKNIDFLDILPNLKCIEIGDNAAHPKDDAYVVGDLLRLGDPFRTILGPVYWEDICETDEIPPESRLQR